MPCKKCIEDAPNWIENVKNGGSAPKCAFPAGIFDSVNWNCATMNALRDLAEEDDRYGVTSARDRSVAVIYFNNMFLVLGWYKHRGQTEHLVEIDGEHHRPVTLKSLEEPPVEADE